MIKDSFFLYQLSMSHKFCSHDSIDYNFNQIFLGNNSIAFLLHDRDCVKYSVSACLCKLCEDAHSTISLRMGCS